MRNNKGSCSVGLIIILLHTGVIIGYGIFCCFYKDIIPKICYRLFPHTPCLHARLINYWNKAHTICTPNYVYFPIPLKIFTVFFYLTIGVILFFLLRKITTSFVKFDTFIQRLIQKGRTPGAESRRLKKRERDKTEIEED